MNTEMWPTPWLGALWPVWTERYFTHTYPVEYSMKSTTHTQPLLLVSYAYMPGCFCLFTSDKSCPAYADRSQHVLWQFIWANGALFSLLCPSHHCNYRSKSSFVLQNASYKEREGVMTARFCFLPVVVSSLHSFLLFLSYSHLHFLPSSDWHAPSLSLISHTSKQFSSNKRMV